MTTVEPSLMLALPWPPSVNRYWRSIGRGRVIVGQAGRLYREAVRECVGSIKQTLNTRIAVTILAYPPDRRKRDLDNLPKAILDSLTHAGVWEDDGLIDDLRIIRKDTHQPGRITLVIRVLEKEV